MNRFDFWMLVIIAVLIIASVVGYIQVVAEIIRG